MPRPKSPDYGTRVLEPGLTGLDVWELQIKLIGWGSGSDADGIGSVMDPVRVHGDYDSTTRDAVKRFQRAHGLTITGVVDAETYRAVDREAGLHPIFIADLACSCTRGVAPPKAGACGGFGKGRFPTKLISPDTLDLDDMEEHAGVDKAALWAARAIMHRAKLSGIKIVKGYQCWRDDDPTTDPEKWKLRWSPLYLGKSIDLVHPGVCVESGAAPCPECTRIREEAVAKCGFQLRWHEPDRVSVADEHSPGPRLSVHLDTARRKGREADDFAKTDADAVKPLYPYQAGLSLPIDLGGGLSPKLSGGAAHFTKNEDSMGGWFPVGRGPGWHGGVHIPADAGKMIHAMFDGEIVGCRVGEEEDAKGFGSRNFILIRHTWKKETFYTLVMHLDDEAASSKSTVPWRRKLFSLSKNHVEVVAPCPLYALNWKLFHLAELRQHGSLEIGDIVETDGAEMEAQTIAPSAAMGRVIRLKDSGNYIYTNRGGVDLAKVVAADAALDGDLKAHKAIGLKQPIRIFAGDVIGKVATKPPKDASLSALGTFFHLEAFAEKPLLTGKGYLAVDASAPDKAADRKEIAAKLVAAKLITAPVDGVLLDADLAKLHTDKAPAILAMRSVVLKTPSAWALDWKAALKSSTTFTFMKDKDRDALGDAYNEYRFWDDVKTADGKLLPGSNVVHHHHPIALLLQIAYAD